MSSENSEVGTEYTPAQSCEYDLIRHELNSNCNDRNLSSLKQQRMCNWCQGCISR